MKRLKQLLFFIPLLALCACTSEGPDISQMTASTYRVQLDQAKNPTYTMNASGDAVSVKVTATCTWQVTQTGGSTGIFTINNGSGSGSGTCSISASANTTVEVRSAEFTITYEDGIKQAFTVNQSAGSVTLTVSLSEFNFPSKAESQETKFTLTCNTNWEIKKSGDVNWLSVSPEKGEGGEYTITVKTDANQPLNKQTCVLTVNSGSMSRTVTITRDAMPVAFGIVPETITVSALGEATEVQVNSNTAWMVSSISQYWVSVVGAQEGTGSGKLQLKCTENTTEEARTAVVTIRTNDDATQEEKTCTITQEAGTRPVVDAFDAVSNARNTATVSYTVSSTTFPVTAVSIDYAVAPVQEEGRELSMADFDAIETKQHKDGTSLTTGSFSLSGLESGTIYYVLLTARNKVGEIRVLRSFETQSQPGRDDNTPPGFEEGEE